MAYASEIGIIGGLCLLAAFGLLNTKVFDARSPAYQTLNLLGALGLTYTAITPFNPGLFLTEVVWAAVAIYGLVRIWTGPRRTAHMESPATES